MRILAILSLIAILQWSNGAKILGVFTVPSKSHCILVYELFIELAKSGHEVSTFLSMNFITKICNLLLYY
jgi:hypothetical protein